MMAATTEPTTNLEGHVDHQVLVVHYGVTAPTLKFLTSYLSTSPRHSDSYPEVIVVDNGPDFSLNRLVRDSRVLVLTKRANLGFGQAFNYAAENAQAAVLVGSNADVDLSYSLARKLVTAVVNSGGLAAPMLIDGQGQAHNKRVFPSGIGLLMARTQLRNRFLYPKDRAESFWVTGACFAVPTKVHERLGGFDDRFFLYFEDVDYCRRLEKAHISVAVIDGLCANHNHERSSRFLLSRAGRFHIQSAIRYFERYPRDVWRGHKRAFV